MKIDMRREQETDYTAVESLTREAFWNFHSPACDEHLLVHNMRTHEDFIKELAYVAVADGVIVANIMYTKARLESEDGEIIPVVCFGPLSVLPAYQRNGIGSQLIEKTKQLVKGMGFAAIVIWGNPCNYVTQGFKNCKDYNISVMKDRFPTCLLVLELHKGLLGKKFYFFKDSEVFKIDNAELIEFEKHFPQKEKKYQYSQELFKILSHSYVK